MFTTGSKELKKHLGQWTQKHSNSGTWESYRIADSNHVYNLCTDKNNNKHWEKCTLHGTKLRLQEDNIDVGDSKSEDGTPIQIRTFSNNERLYGDMTAVTMDETITW